MSTMELYEVYSRQQSDYQSASAHNDGPQHFDYPHQDYYTDEIH